LALRIISRSTTDHRGRAGALIYQADNLALLALAAVMIADQKSIVSTNCRWQSAHRRRPIETGDEPAPPHIIAADASTSSRWLFR